METVTEKGKMNMEKNVRKEKQIGKIKTNKRKEKKQWKGEKMRKKHDNKDVN